MTTYLSSRYRPTIGQGRMGVVIRQWRMLRVLASTRYQTVATLSAELECSVRTIRRDLAALAAAGFPLRWAQGEFVRLHPDWFCRSEPAVSLVRRGNQVAHDHHRQV